MQITFNTAPLDEQVDRLEAINPELDLTELDREVTRLENIKLNDVTVNTDPLQLQVNRLEELVTSLDSITVSDSGVYRILPGYIAIACQDVCEQAGLGNSGYWHPLTTMNVSGRTVTIALTSGEYPASFVYGEFVTLFRRDHFLTIRILQTFAEGQTPLKVAFFPQTYKTTDTYLTHMTRTVTSTSYTNYIKFYTLAEKPNEADSSKYTLGFSYIDILVTPN